ncbi:MAG: NAD(+) synthase [Candidatus Thiodiazotropha sp. (ex Dulcina madagascariensis)]|nr:NAD(+) synthase [Candidatus Thiodiazotropha sp. (ex Dulcina madagascariensis)]MCU7925537.1 NAD(+) synthase [Candidatus Thiodiazotropha sp. (ex Dulcina madagascariensis)]
MQSLSERYEAEVINFDRDKAVERICETMRDIMRSKLRRRGVVVAVSGGIDSSVSAALAVKAFGANKAFFIQLPEVDSAADTQSRGRQLIDLLGVDHTTHNIAATLQAIGCYDARDEAIKKTFPEYAKGWKNKIVIKGGLDGQVNHFMLVVQDPQGALHEKRLDLREYLQIVAATNYKQRIRKSIEYYHADRLNYAVVGTPNRLEYDQGFFVKNGDGSADLKPIAHLYKTQVYALAKHLDLPDSICNATPTTDTYSLPQGQDEFYFALPYQAMDKALWARNIGASASDLAGMLNISEEQAKFVFQDIDNKRKTTHYLHAKPYLIEPIPELNL